MTEEMKAKRADLHDLSQIAKEYIKIGEADSINEGLKLIYAEDGHLELKTFKQWLSDGKVVKKGEKALLLWAKPLKEQKEEQNPQPKEEEPNGKDFFPIAYVVSNLQVEPLKKLAA